MNDKQCYSFTLLASDLASSLLGGSPKRPGPGSVQKKMLQSVAVVLESKSESCTGKLLYAAES